MGRPWQKTRLCPDLRANEMRALAIYLDLANNAGELPAEQYIIVRPVRKSYRKSIPRQRTRPRPTAIVHLGAAIP